MERQQRKGEKERKVCQSKDFRGKNKGIHLQNVTTIIANQGEPTQFMHSFFFWLVEMQAKEVTEV